jgi:Zn-dependent M28 family amino/carboxypeptidase
LGRTREFIIAELRAAGVTVVRDTFIASTPLGPIPMSNIVAKIPGDSSAVVIIAGHYDTKRTNFPFVGANDGGSSAAFLLEMARVLARRMNPLSYWLVFFDGEEAVQRWSTTDGLYGSRHFAQELSAQGTLNRVRALILVDMIADAHLDIHREAHSTPWLSDIVFGEAQRIGYGRYFQNSPSAIEDDHVPFLDLGVPAVDIIDLNYGPFNLYWHSRYDTVDKCSPASLAIVARIVLATLVALETTRSRPGGASS